MLTSGTDRQWRSRAHETPSPGIVRGEDQRGRQLGVVGEAAREGAVAGRGRESETRTTGAGAAARSARVGRGGEARGPYREESLSLIGVPR
jgi:hypothetical protein